MEAIFENIVSWLLTHGLRILSIVIGAALLDWFLAIFIGKAVRNKIKGRVSEKREKRIETLISVFSGTSKFTIWLIALLMVLPEFGINIAPILTGVGILGLAVGMAARGIVSDFISGVFIILEDQYHIGDEVKIAGLEGRVKELNLRRTVLEDKEGILHLIPNSQVKVVSKRKS